MNVKVNKEELLKDVRDCIKIDVDLDTLVLRQIDKLVIPAVDHALAKACKAIPGPIDDGVVAALKPELYKGVKEYVAKALQKVEDRIETTVSGSPA